MKKVMILLAITVFLTGCPNPANGNKKPNPENPNFAKVVIPLPKVSNSGRSISVQTAKDHTNYYQVNFREVGHPAFLYKETATPADGKIELSVSAGTYDILLLAGYNESGVGYPLVIASGCVLNQSIVVEEVNEINITLNTIDINITSPNRALCDEPFDVEVEVDTKNPLIILGDIDMYLNATTIIEDTYTPVSVENNISKFKMTLTAPPTSTSGYIALRKLWRANGGDFHYLAHGGSASSLCLYFRKSDISFIESPETRITITWADE